LALQKYYITKRLTAPILTVFICAGMVLLNLAFKLVFDTPYLLERSALVMYVPFIFGILKLMDESKTYERFRSIRLVTGIFACISISLYLFNFYNSFSLRYFKEWPIQTDTKKCIDQLSRMRAGNVGMSIWQYSVHRNYYSMAFPEKYPFTYEMVDITTAPFQSAPKYDYLLLDSIPGHKEMWSKNWELVKRFEPSGAAILKRIQK
jgi:hypothetical protein